MTTIKKNHLEIGGHKWVKTFHTTLSRITGKSVRIPGSYYHVCSVCDVIAQINGGHGQCEDQKEQE